MTYIPTKWENFPSTNTPIDADNLNKIEQGVKSAHDGVDATNVALNNKLDKSAVVQSTGQSTTNVMSQKAVTDSLLGINQNWVDVTNNRALGVSYTNEGTSPIVVTSWPIRGRGFSLSLYVDGVTVSSLYKSKVADAEDDSTILGIIPPSSVYKITLSVNDGGAAPGKIMWSELR